MKNTNPLIDALAILICLIAVIVGGQYFINQKEARDSNNVRNVSGAELEKGVKLEVGKPIRIIFESTSKATE